MGKQWKQCLTLFFWAPKSLQTVTAAMKLKDASPGKESYDQPKQHIEKQRHYFANKGPSSQGYDFSSSHVWMWVGCEKAERQRIDAFELWCWRLLRVPWTARRSNQPILKEISPGCSLEGLMLKLKLQYFGYLMQRTDLFEKTERGWGQEEKGMTEDEVVGWHHWLNGHEFRWTLGVGDGQGALACCGSGGHKESDTIERLNLLIPIGELEKGRD